MSTETTDLFEVGHIDYVTDCPLDEVAAALRDGPEFGFTPFGHLTNGNPHDACVPPSPTLRDDPVS
jgi:hypothetical protein